MSLVIPPLYEWGLYCNHLVRPSVHTFVTDISVSTGRNDFIFDIWLYIKSFLPVEAEITVTKVFITANMKNSKSHCKQEVDVR
jgi:hypothetical protein